MVFRTKLYILVNDSPSLINAKALRSSNWKEASWRAESGVTRVPSTCRDEAMLTLACQTLKVTGPGTGCQCVAHRNTASLSSLGV